MRRLGPLLALIALLLVTFASSAQARPNHASGPHDAPPGRGLEQATQEEGDEHRSTSSGSSSKAGRGMNRMGGPATHPGKGWKDPGQLQGSIKNTADPDCTGNRSLQPQPTNLGSCDNDQGAADKPGGSGGFDGDRDFNNGCGNDTDFEDDNNGRCGRRPGNVGGASSPTDPPPKKERKVVTRVLSSVTARPVVVLSERVTARRTSLPATGIDANQIAFAGISLMAIGKGMVRRARGNRH